MCSMSDSISPGIQRSWRTKNTLQQHAQAPWVYGHIIKYSTHICWLCKSIFISPSQVEPLQLQLILISVSQECSRSLGDATKLRATRGPPCVVPFQSHVVGPPMCKQPAICRRYILYSNTQTTQHGTDEVMLRIYAIYGHVMKCMEYRSKLVEGIDRSPSD